MNILSEKTKNARKSRNDIKIIRLIRDNRIMLNFSTFLIKGTCYILQLGSSLLEIIVACMHIALDLVQQYINI